MLLQVALLRSEEFMLFRQNNTSMVLGTDMKKHFDIMSRFQVCFCSSVHPRRILLLLISLQQCFYN